MTTIGSKDDLIPIALSVSVQEPASECPADFETLIDTVMMRVPVYGTMVVTIDPLAGDSAQVRSPDEHIVFCCDEGRLMRSVSSLLMYVFGSPLPDGNPVSMNRRLVGWNLRQDIWPLICTKWLHYKAECGPMPYRAMLQDPASQWLSHYCLLNADSVYRQGRPTRHGFCEVSLPDAAKYYNGTDLSAVRFENATERVSWWRDYRKDALADADATMDVLTDMVWDIYKENV